MSNILITGGTGLVGTELTKLLSNEGHDVAYLSRSKQSGLIKSYLWDYGKNEIDLEALKWADIIVHLAGTSVADKRWTSKRKQDIYDSRILTTRLIREKLQENEIDISHFISASATGFYAQTSEEAYDETALPGDDFLAKVVADWEKEIFEFEKLDITTTAVRISVVLSEKSGAFPQLLLPIKLGFGAALGSGKQVMPWIHLDDLARLFDHIIDNKSSGIYNAAATENVTNKEFNKLLADKLRKRLWMPNVPAFALKLLLGEMSSVVTKGTYVSNQKIKQEGFQFKYDSLPLALDELLQE